MSGTKIFQSMGFVQEYSKYYKVSLWTKFRKNWWLNFPINSENSVYGTFLAHFPHFGGKKKLSWKIWLSRTTSYGFLAPCQNFKKVNDTIQRKCPDRWKDGQKDRRTDGQTLFYRNLPATAGGPTSKNKIWTYPQISKSVTSS